MDALFRQALQQPEPIVNSSEGAEPVPAESPNEATIEPAKTTSTDPSQE